MPTEDVKLLRRKLRACLQEVTSSFRLFKLARSSLQMMKYFSHRHKLQRFESGLKGAACFKIFQVKLNPILASFKCKMCLLSSVLILLFGSLKEDLWFEYLVLNGGAKLQVTGQVTGHRPGHRSDHRPQVRSQVRSQVTLKNNRTLDKTVLD